MIVDSIVFAFYSLAFRGERCRMKATLEHSLCIRRLV